MSRTYQTTPSFPRTLRGPRGGRSVAPTPCAACVSFTSCRPGACSAPYGCESWVDEEGRRVDVLADLDPQPVDLAALDESDPDDVRTPWDMSRTLSGHRHQRPRPTLSGPGIQLKEDDSMSDLHTKDGKLYAGDRPVIKGWESF